MGHNSMTAWKHISASVVGTSHDLTGTPCQDNSVCRAFTLGDGSEILVAVASDGAGSAKRADEGSAIACSLLIQEMEALFEADAEGDLSEITKEFLANWLVSFQREVTIRAEHEELRARDFACTLVAAIIGEQSAVFAQIGDGAIVVPSPEEPDEYCYVFWPQKGEYANETYFATDPEAHTKIQYDHIPRRIDEVALLTDGIQNLALHYQTQSAHSPFFRPVFAWLRPASEDYKDKFTASLAAYLASEKINQATDDDKTLILATRTISQEPKAASTEETNVTTVLQQ
jgi:hypothetical protein